MMIWLALAALLLSRGPEHALASPAASLEAQDPTGVELEDDLRAALTAYFEGEPLSHDREGQERKLKPIQVGLERFAREHGIGTSVDDLLRRPDVLARILQSWPRWEEAPPGGELFEESYFNHGQQWTYFLHLPEGYRSGIDRPPLIVDLWSGEDARAHFQRYWQGDPLLQEAVLLLPPRLSEVSVWLWLFEPTPFLEVPLLVEREVELLLPAGDGWRDSVWEPLISIEHFWDRFSIDEDRILLSARGEESALAAEIAAHFKDIFAGLILWDGVVDVSYFAPNLSHMGVYAPAGGPLVEALEARGAPVVRQADLVEWVWRTRVERYPEQFEVVVPHPRWGDAWWIKVYDIEPMRDTELGPGVRPEDLPGVRVELDRERNRIVLETRRVRVLRIRLNDRIVDLDRPVSVVLEGEAAERVRGESDESLVIVEAALERSLALALENVWRTGERRRIFVNDLWVFVP